MVLVTRVAMGLHCLGVNPMKALVWSSSVQGFSTPPRLLLRLLMTNNWRMMGAPVNSRALKLVGWITTGAICAARVGLGLRWFR
jgi:Mn2+/Fe2+ NRAMP family transporter